jgi:hypothetical protein
MGKENVQMLENFSTKELMMILGALKNVADRQREMAAFSEDKTIAGIYGHNAKKYEELYDKIKEDVDVKLAIEKQKLNQLEFKREYKSEWIGNK